MRLSRGFICALIGVAMTLLAWYGPWAWPAWPAFTAIDVLFGHAGYAEYPYAVRAAILVGLIVLNVSFWGVIAFAASTILRWPARAS
ncbi:MAG TPA: hypothetical protein VGK31_07660 [Thermoanaerobaculia bacterium]|jgi:hypothetical protein